MHVICKNPACEMLTKPMGYSCEFCGQDILIFEPKGKFHGLCIEFKREGEKLFKKDGIQHVTKHVQEQDELLQRLSKKGYYATFSIGYEETKHLIDSYMNF